MTGAFLWLLLLLPAVGSAAVSTAATPAVTASSAASGASMRFAPEADYGPFVFVDARGTVQGLSVDLLQSLLKGSGVRLQMLPARPLADQLALLRSGQADLISSLRPTIERGRYLLFTRPYVSVPAVLVSPIAGKAGGKAGGTTLSAFSGRKVAVGAAYAVEAHVRAHHPDVAWQAVPDDGVALRGVAQGRYDAAVVDAASATFIIRREGLSSLGSLGPVGFEYGLSFAVPHARADLLAFLEERIARHPHAQRQAIVQRWMAPLGPATAPPRAPGAERAGWLLLVAAAVAALAVWLLRRQRSPGVPPR